MSDEKKLRLHCRMCGFDFAEYDFVGHVTTKDLMNAIGLSTNIDWDKKQVEFMVGPISSFLMMRGLDVVSDTGIGFDIGASNEDETST